MTSYSRDNRMAQADPNLAEHTKSKNAPSGSFGTALTNPNAAAQRRMQADLNRSPNVESQMQLKKTLQRSPRVVEQVRLAEKLSSKAVAHQPGLVVQRHTSSEKTAGRSDSVTNSPAVIQMLTKEQKERLAPIAEFIEKTARVAFELSGQLQLEPLTPQKMKAQFEDLLPALANAVGELWELASEIKPGDSENLIIRAARGAIRLISKEIYDTHIGTIDKLIDTGLGSSQAQAAFANLKRIFKQASTIYTTEAGVLRSLSGGVSFSFSIFEPPSPNEGFIYKSENLNVGRPESRQASRILERLKEKQITSVDFLNYDRQNYENTSTLLNALLRVASASNPLGSVSNVLVPLEVGEDEVRRAMVKIIISQDGAVTIDIISTREPRVESAYGSVEQAKKAIVERFGLAAITDGDKAWSLDELAKLEMALARVPPADRDILQGLTVSRNSIDPKKKGGFQHPLANYQESTHTLNVFNLGFEPDEGSFVGVKGETAPASVRAILHEIGHAVEFAERTREKRELAEQSEKTRFEIEGLTRESSAIQEQYQRIDREIAAVRERQERLEEEIMKLAVEVDSANDALGKIFSVYQAAKGPVGKYFNETVNPAIRAAKLPIAMQDKCTTYYKSSFAALQAMLNITKSSFGPGTIGTLRELIDKAQLAGQQFRAAEQASQCPDFFKLDTLLTELEKSFQILSGVEPAQENILKAHAQYEEWKKREAVLEEEIRVLEQRQKELSGPQSEVNARIRDARRRQSAIDERSRELLFDENMTRRLQTFAKFVKRENIPPITGYAKDTVAKGNYQEFFAEAYSIFLTEPEFLARFHPALFNYFDRKEY